MGTSEGSGPEADRNLLSRVANRDQQAFETLYRRLERRLFLYLIGLVGDAIVAEELTSEVFFEVWRNAGTFRRESSVSSWIFGIARHRAFSLLRKKNPVSETVESLEGFPANTDGPVEALSQKDLADRVREGLKSLSAEHREVIELSLYHGLSYHEIAEIAGCPVNTIKTRAHYARQHLKRILARLGVAKGTV